MCYISSFVHVCWEQWWWLGRADPQFTLVASHKYPEIKCSSGSFHIYTESLHLQTFTFGPTASLQYAWCTLVVTKETTTKTIYHKSETAQIYHKTSSRMFGCTWSSSGLWLGSNSWPYDDDHQRKNWMLSLCAPCLVCLVSQVCKLKHISPWFSFFLRKCITTNHIRWFTLFKGLRMVLCWWSLGATQDFPYSGLQVVAASHYTGQQALCYWDSFACTLIDFTC